jgi:hypothetical protein
MPANATMSPAPRLVHLDADRARGNPSTWMIFSLRALPSRSTTVTGMPADLAALDAADADRADVARVVELAHLQLQRAVDVDVRRRAVLDDRLEQRRHVAAAVAGSNAAKPRIAEA